ncbi:hypothetical protein OG21DRAFT_1522705 [Imleria badia]|nr:hypothetical protein OG21DRAFT_1522705 [Imleria badia]
MARPIAHEVIEVLPNEQHVKECCRNCHMSMADGYNHCRGICESKWPGPVLVNDELDFAVVVLTGPEAMGYCTSGTDVGLLTTATTYIASETWDFVDVSFGSEQNRADAEERRFPGGRPEKVTNITARTNGTGVKPQRLVNCLPGATRIAVKTLRRQERDVCLTGYPSGINTKDLVVWVAKKLLVASVPMVIGEMGELYSVQRIIPTKWTDSQLLMVVLGYGR